MSQPTPDSAARRELLQLLGFCSVTSLIPAARPLAKAPALLSSEALAPNVLWIRGAGCNVVVIRDARGLAFIDGGLAVHADAVLRHAREKLGAGPAHTLINTHWHPEHVGLNETLGKAGAKIIAHENTRLWLSTTVERELDGAAVKPLSPKARPNATTYTEGEIALGEETVHYGYLAQAHTDGDLYVHLRKADVLVTGGVVAGKGWSIVDYATGGWINGLVAGHRGLQKSALPTRASSPPRATVCSRSGSSKRKEPCSPSWRNNWRRCCVRGSGHATCLPPRRQRTMRRASATPRNS